MKHLGTTNDTGPGSGPMMSFRGAWSSGIAYYAGDVVTYGGKLWTATQDVPANGASFVGSSSGNTGGPTQAAWHLPLPAGCAPGDLAVVEVAADTPTVQPTGPSGGTTVVGAAGWGAAMYANIYTYSISAGDIANGYIPMLGNATATTTISALAMVFRGTNGTADVFVTSGTSSTAHATGTLTPTASAFVLSFYRGSFATTSPVTNVTTNPTQSGGTFYNSSTNANPHAALAACYTTVASGSSVAVTFAATPVDTSAQTAQVAVLNGVLPVASFAELAMDNAAAPVGTIHMYAGAVLPTGYLYCAGAAVSRNTYAALYAALGGNASPWGQGDGSTTFNLPNFSNRMPRGSTIGVAGGNDSHTHVNPNHTHTLGASGSARIMATGTNIVVDTAGNATTFTPNWTATATGFTRTAGGTAPGASVALNGTTELSGSTTTGGPDNIPAYMGTSFIIKY